MIFPFLSSFFTLIIVLCPLYLLPLEESMPPHSLLLISRSLRQAGIHVLMTPDQLCKLSALVHNDDTAFVAIALLVFSFQPSDVQWAQIQRSSAPNNDIENTTRAIMSGCRLFMYDHFPYCKPTKLLYFDLEETSFTQSLQQASSKSSTSDFSTRLLYHY